MSHASNMQKGGFTIVKSHGKRKKYQKQANLYKDLDTVEHVNVEKVLQKMETYKYALQNFEIQFFRSEMQLYVASLHSMFCKL